MKKLITPFATKWYLVISLFFVLFFLFLFSVLYESELKKIPVFFSTNSTQSGPTLRADPTPFPSISAGGILSVLISEKNVPTILAQRNATTTFPVASLTKLMTAIIVKETFDLDSTITISTTAESQALTSGQVLAGESYSVRSLFLPLLVESSNDVAYALAENSPRGYADFIVEMNSKATSIGMKATHFSNPHGLDPKNEMPDPNYATPEDLVTLSRYIMDTHLDIFAITTASTSRLIPSAGKPIKILNSTNVLLSMPPDTLPVEILGGKTGETPRAKQALILITRAPHHKSYIISIILRSDDRFGDMISLVKWVADSYNW